MIYDDIGRGNGKQNADESCTNKYQNHVGCNFGYKLVFADDQFSKLFNSYLGEDVVHMFNTNMVKQSKYCSRVTKQLFNKELFTTKRMTKILKALQNIGFVTKVVLKVRDHCSHHWKIQGAAHRDFDMNDNLNYKIPIKFRNLKNYDAHINM